MTGVEPELLEMPERRGVVIARDFTMKTRDEIPTLFEAFFSRNVKIPSAETDALLGVSYNMDDKGSFRYGVGRVVHEFADAIPDGMEAVELVAGTYAVFRAFGQVSDIPEMFDWVFSSWFRESGFSITGDPVFERYPNDPRNGDNGIAFEIWSPVRR
ncbi:MAG: GyrI-like domain-containing protein [Boseongicola sp.]